MVDYTDALGNMNGSPLPEPEVKPSAAPTAAPAATPAEKAPEYVRTPMGAPSRPQAAAPAKPAAAQTQASAAPAAATPSGAVGAAKAAAPTAQAGAAAGMQGMDFSKIFMALLAPFFAMFMGMFPSAQAAQAKPNSPAVTASLAAAGAATPGIKPAGPTPTPSQSQARAADNKIDADAKLAAATPPKPDTGVNTTTGVQPETDDQRRDRLGMSPKQYNKLAAEESEWQADAKTSREGAVGDSPFVRADRQDSMAQQKLGLDAIQWQVLKQENKDWQTKKEAGDTTLAQTGPIQQAFADNEKKTALAAATPAAPVPTPPAAAPAVQPQIFVGPPGQGVPGVQPRVYTERNNEGGAVNVIPQQYEQPSYTRADSRPPRYDGPTEYGMVRTQFNNSSGQDQLNRTLSARAEYRAQGYAPQVANKLVEQDRRAELTEELSRRGLDQRTIARTVDSTIRSESGLANMQESAVRQQDNQAMRQAQANERREAAERARDTADAKRNWGGIASGGVTLGGGNSREAGAARDVAGGIAGVVGAMGDGGGRASPQQRQAETGFRNDMGNIGKGAAILKGATGREAGAVGEFIRGGVGVFQKMGFGGGEESAPKARVVEYPAQSRGDYEVKSQTADWVVSNKYSPEYNKAGSYGATPEDRAEILRKFEMEKNAPAAAQSDLSADKPVVTAARRQDNFSIG